MHESVSDLVVVCRQLFVIVCGRPTTVSVRIVRL